MIQPRLLSEIAQNGCIQVLIDGIFYDLFQEFLKKFDLELLIKFLQKFISDFLQNFIKISLLWFKHLSNNFSNNISKLHEFFKTKLKVPRQLLYYSHSYRYFPNYSYLNYSRKSLRISWISLVGHYTEIRFFFSVILVFYQENPSSRIQ